MAIFTVVGFILDFGVEKWFIRGCGRVACDKGLQHVRQIGFAGDEVDVVRAVQAFIRGSQRQAAGNYNCGVWVQLAGFSNDLAAFCRGNMRNTARVDDHKVGVVVFIDVCQPVVGQQLSYLAAFVLIDLAAQCVDGKSIHFRL